MWKKGINYLDEPYKTLISKLLETLIEFFGDRLVSLVVYGSVARGDTRSDSDIDLLVIAKELPRSRLARQDLFMKVEEHLAKILDSLRAQGIHVDFSPILRTPDEASRITPLYLDMVEDALIVYDRDEFFETVLRRLKNRLDELGAERIRVGKKWYWRLKKDYKFGEVIKIE